MRKPMVSDKKVLELYHQWKNETDIKKQDDIFEKIVKECDFFMYHFTKKFYFRWEDETDIKQIIRIQILKSLNLYDEALSPRIGAWIYLNCRSALITMLVKQSQPKNGIAAVTYSLDAVINNDDNKEMTMEFPEAPPKTNYGELLTIILDNASLTALERRIVEEYAAGYRYEDISAKYGIAEKTVDNALCRVKNKAKRTVIKRPQFKQMWIDYKSPNR